MKRKKAICLITTLALAATVFAACGKTDATNPQSAGGEKTKVRLVNENGEEDPYGVYAEKVQLKIAQSVNPADVFPEGQSSTDNVFFDIFRDELNIEVEVMWQAGTGNDYNEKLNLAISSGELPDIFTVNEAQLSMLVKSDMLEDLTVYYETNACESIKKNIDSSGGKALETVTFNGKIMALPNVRASKDGYDLMWIRQDWLDDLELSVPENLTQLREVAKAFVENKMGGENTVGLLAPTSSNLLYANFLESNATMCGLDGVFQANRAYPGYWVKDENGEVVYGSLTEETKETLAILSQMYQEGSLDPELGTRKDADEAWKSGQAGIFFGPWWVGYNLADALANDPTAEWIAYPYPLTEDGKWAPHMQNPSDSFLVVRKGYEHPEIIYVINNFLANPENGARLDTVGVQPGYIPGRVLVNTAKPAVSDSQIIREYLATGVVPEYDISEHSRLQADIDSVKEYKLEPYDDMGIEYWSASKEGNFGRLYSTLVGVGAIDDGYDIGCEEGYSLLYSQTDSMQKKWSTLKKLEDETFLKIILGSASLEDFDTFVEDWYSQGGEEITREVAEIVSK